MSNSTALKRIRPQDLEAFNKMRDEGAVSVHFDGFSVTPYEYKGHFGAYVTMNLHTTPEHRGPNHEGNHSKGAEAAALTALGKSLSSKGFDANFHITAYIQGGNNHVHIGELPDHSQDTLGAIFDAINASIPNVLEAAKGNSGVLEAQANLIESAVETSRARVMSINE